MKRQPRVRTSVLFGLAVMLAGLWQSETGIAQDVSAEQVTLRYYRALAESGSADAQLVLGDRYRHGEGVAQDLVEAYAWYYLAVHQGVEEGIRPMNEVLRQLSPQRQQAAKRRAEDYAGRFIP